jgi:hypothetical protein
VDTKISDFGSVRLRGKDEIAVLENNIFVHKHSIRNFVLKRLSMSKFLVFVILSLLNPDGVCLLEK